MQGLHREVPTLHSIFLSVSKKPPSYTTFKLYIIIYIIPKLRFITSSNLRIIISKRSV